jgi:hypothetical protein
MEGPNKGKPGRCPKGMQGSPRPDKPKQVKPKTGKKPIVNQPTPKVSKPKPPAVKPKKTQKLTKEQQAQADREDYKTNGVKAKSFKKWFGDWEYDAPNASKVIDPKTGQPQQTMPTEVSKVRDEEGNVQVVYHGTPFAAFDEFLKSKQANGNELLYGPGFYFSDSEDYVKEYQAGTTGGGHLFKVYLNIRKPFDLDNDKIPLDKLPPKVQSQFASPEVSWEDLTDKEVWDKRAKPKMTKIETTELLEKLGYDGITHASNSGYRIWVAFDPKQIKSVDNEGTFDPKSAKINKHLIET